MLVIEMQALIDGDILVYRCGFAAEKQRYKLLFKDGTKDDILASEYRKSTQEYKDSIESMERYTAPEPIENALFTTKRVIQKILKDVGTDSYKIYLTSDDKSNFRFNLATIKEYKGNRKNSKKPLHYKAIREYLVNYHAAEVISGMEADDAMGINMCNGCGTKICCTIDKDLRMIPGLHHHLDWEKQGLNKIEKIEDPGFVRLETTKTGRNKIWGGGMLWFYAQMLLGDSADNIPKIPKMGPVSVTNLLRDKTSDEAKQVVVGVYNEHFLKKGHTTSEISAILKEVGSLLWIRRK